MISLLIIYVLNRYRTRHPAAWSRARTIIKRLGKPLLLVLAGCMAAVLVFSQERKLEYQVKRKGEVVGTVLFRQVRIDSDTRMYLQSDIKFRFIFLLSAKVQEEVVFRNGVMVQSAVYRKMNGNEKMNKKTESTGHSYVVHNGRVREVLKEYPIRHTMISLYIYEPRDYSTVYSDSFQQFLAIQKLADQHYKIILPDGSYNEYFYANGICRRVEVHHSMYRATFELKNGTH